MLPGHGIAAIPPRLLGRNVKVILLTHKTGTSERATVSQVLAAWGLAAHECVHRGSVLRVETESGPFCLKPVRKSQGRLDFMHAVQEHVRAHSFDRVQPLLPTVDGGVAFWRRGVAWTLTPWVEGHDMSYDNPDELAAAAAVLASFHVAVGGFRSPSSSRWQSNLGKWPAKIASRCAELLAAARLANLSASGSPPAMDVDAEVLGSSGEAGNGSFARHLAGHGPTLARHSRRSLLMLSSPAYQRLCRKQGEDVPVCHGDPAAHNFVVRLDGLVEMIDLNSLRVDLPCVDLWKLIRRAAFHVDWDFGTVRRILDAYSAVRPTEPDERQVLLGLLWFPEKQWRLVVDSAKHRPEWTPGQPETALPRSLISEMARAGRQMPAKERCLEDLERQEDNSP